MRTRALVAACVLCAVTVSREALALGAVGHYYTALWLSDQIRANAVQAPALLQQALQYGPAREAFCAGAMYPDLVDAAVSHQGNNGDLVKRMLDQASRNLASATTPQQRGQALTEVAFVYGWMTHMGADLVAHPLINTEVGETYRHTDSSGQRAHAVRELQMDRAIFSIADRSGAASPTVPALTVPDSFIKQFVTTTETLDTFKVLKLELSVVSRVPETQARRDWDVLAQSIADEFVKISADKDRIPNRDLDTGNISSRQYDDIYNRMVVRGGGAPPRDMSETLARLLAEVTDLQVRVQDLLPAYAETKKVLDAVAAAAEDMSKQHAEVARLVQQLRDRPGRDLPQLVAAVKAMCAAAHATTLDASSRAAAAKAAPRQIEELRSRLAEVDRRRADLHRVIDALAPIVNAKPTVMTAPNTPSALLLRRPGNPGGLTPIRSEDVVALRSSVADLQALLALPNDVTVSVSATMVVNNATELLGQPWVREIERGLDYHAFYRLQQANEHLLKILADARDQLAALPTDMQQLESAERALAEGKECAEVLGTPLSKVADAPKAPPAPTPVRPPAANACEAKCQKGYDLSTAAAAAALKDRRYYVGLASGHCPTPWETSPRNACAAAYMECDGRCGLYDTKCKRPCFEALQSCCNTNALHNADHDRETCLKECGATAAPQQR